MRPPTPIDFSWQNYAKGGSHPDTAAYRNLATEFFDYTVGYEQAEAGAALLTAVFRSKEGFKNMAYDILRYSFAIINDINLN
jgi:hypothetical protein